MKILLISTGGTIASVKEKNIHLDAPFKILDYIPKDETNGVEFEYAVPFTVLSENINFEQWQKLCGIINENNINNIIILHGSDTLAFTSSLVGKLFPDKNIVVTASNKPCEDEYSNAVSNFLAALRQVKKGQKGVFVSYDGVYPAETIASADGFDIFRAVGKPDGKSKSEFKPKNILIIKPYVNINYDNYNLNGVDTVLHEMYHSATVPDASKIFAKKCRDMGIPFYFVTPKSSADYESAKDIKDMIIYNSTTENAFAILNCD